MGEAEFLVLGPLVAVAGLSAPARLLSIPPHRAHVPPRGDLVVAAAFRPCDRDLTLAWVSASNLGKRFDVRHDTILVPIWRHVNAIMAHGGVGAGVGARTRRGGAPWR